MKQPSLFDASPDANAPADQAARDFAVDPGHDVVLEASAGTGKTRVLVDRYAALIQAGVDPRHILAITFTRKAAAEMRSRVLAELTRRAERGELAPDIWRRLRERIADIEISTIDAFCFGLLREFPLEADVDPAFEIADETEMARFASEALDLTLRASRRLIVDDGNVRLLFARVKQPVLRNALEACLDRRQVALPAVARFVERHVRHRTAPEAAAEFVERLRSLVGTSIHRPALLDRGPAGMPEFDRLRADLAALDEFPATDPAQVQHLRRRVERYFLTSSKSARQKLSKPFSEGFATPAARKAHEAALAAISPGVLESLNQLDSDVSGLLARGLLRVLTIAVQKYEELLNEHALLDFAGMLHRSVALLGRQEEFSRSRLKLQSRYHHVLVDEFQDTSRAQWQLIELLVDAWGEGEGVTDAPTSIFIVGDRKQSIYRFRQAEATLLDEAAEKISALRTGSAPRRAITHSFRAVPELLAFVNALAGEMQGDPELEDRFRYGASDRFPVPAVEPGARRDGAPVLGLVAEPSIALCAQAVAAETARLLETAVVRDPRGPSRPARPEDIAVLFRARAGHQYFEEALEARGIRTYVYKGLGFFDAPEVQDLQALVRYLAQPESDLRAAELLRSRLVRVSDVGLTRLAPSFAGALRAPDFDAAAAGLGDLDARLVAHLREGLVRWLALADRITPSELIDLILRETAYAFEMRGRRLEQARENVKKMRGLIRRIENRGYTTLGRLADYFEKLRAGDESNAVVQATGAVNLMTIHAAKGLEFPIVFVVNLHVPGRRGSAITVIDRALNQEPHVAFGPSPETRAEERREIEEQRRLLYVAVTRARDRLYLAAETEDDGRVKRPAHSLAALLPTNLATTIALGARAAPEITWESREGSFAFRVVHPEPAVPRTPEPARTPGPPVLGPLATGAGVVAATAVGRSATARDASGAVTIERLTGTLVHRLFERRLPATADAADVRLALARLVRVEELVDVTDVASLEQSVVDFYLALRGREEVSGLLGAGTCLYEVPFSYQPGASAREDGALVRGVVDCLVVTSDGRVTVLEFKTGQPRPEHERQAGVYADAIGALFGPDRVVVKIVYP
ncbi:MAG TPA: UvrD-helicase domain-containing protein [Vicinamibacterales bacterium]|nr:UvrD-helicase domain-containing protein [Vicinamibacterales bacterium]